MLIGHDIFDRDIHLPVQLTLELRDFLLDFLVKEIRGLLGLICLKNVLGSRTD